MDNHSTYYPDIGHQGEAFVAQWLQQQGWQILERRWRCRWGELDIIAYNTGTVSCSALPAPPGTQIRLTTEPTIAFIEVKTRQYRNWDADGRLAITPQKQAKIIRAAQLYLAEHTRWANSVCRFDVAIVEHTPGRLIQPSSSLRMKEYIVSAWEFWE